MDGTFRRHERHEIYVLNFSGETLREDDKDRVRKELGKSYKFS
jgi:hypothetical protein